MKQSKNYLVCSEDVFQSSRLQNITDFLCTLYKIRKFRFYPLSHTHDPVFLNSPRRSPKRKKLPKDRGVSAYLIHALGAFRVKNQTYAATTTPHRKWLQSYDIHIFIIVFKDVSTCIVESAFTYHGNSSINRTRAHVLIYAIGLASLQYISCHALSWCIVFNDMMQTTRKKRTVKPSTHVYIY